MSEMRERYALPSLVSRCSPPAICQSRTATPGPARAKLDSTLTPLADGLRRGTTGQSVMIAPPETMAYRASGAVPARAS